MSRPLLSALLSARPTTLGLVVALALIIAPQARAQSPGPLDSAGDRDLDEAAWASRTDAAEGKYRRGVGLTIFGGLSTGLTAWLIYEARSDQQRYLMPALVSGAANLGAIGHGISSIIAGRREAAKARAFAGQNPADTSASDIAEQRAYLAQLERRGQIKLAIFGGFLLSEAAALSVHAIVLSVRRARGRDLRGAKAWPSYVLGGIFLPAGTWLMATQLRALTTGAEAPTRARQTSWSLGPYGGPGELGLRWSGRF